MKTHVDCIPCFLRQSLEAARMASKDIKTQEILMKEVMRYLQTISYEKSPPEISKEVHRIIRKNTGSLDPYKKVKQQSNDIAEQLYTSLKKQVVESKDPLFTALHLSIVGNVIDFGTANRFSIEDMLQKPLLKDFSDRVYPLFKETVSKASHILYLADNAGEIFFDKLLIEELSLKNKKIFFAVKANPIINDALFEDAMYAGIDAYADIIKADEGQPASTPGVFLPFASKAFLKVFESVDMVISKGQGNYESLNDHSREIFFLLTVKCPLVANDVGAPLASLVLTVNR